MGNWSEVPHDLLEFIAKRVDKLDDFVRFGAVCKSWHAAAEKEIFKGVALRENIPYLMLAAERKGEEREFYSLQEHEIVAKITLPSLKGKKCIESLGWWLIVGSEGDMKLLNPFTGVEIELPNYTTFPHVMGDYLISGEPFTFVQRMVLSSRPDKSLDFVVMVLAGNHDLGFWRPGDLKWNSLDKYKGPYRDVTYFNGKFYAVNSHGFVLVFDLTGANPREGRVLTHLLNNELVKTIDLDEIPTPSNYGFDDYDMCEFNLYIAEFSDALLIIARDARGCDEAEQKILYDTEKFHLLKVDTSSGRWERIHSLGSKAAFVGHSATTLVEISKFHEFKANHIYFTIDCWYLIDLVVMGDQENSCKDVGVYNVETEEVEPFYHGDESKLFSEISPAVWVTPSFI